VVQFKNYGVNGVVMAATGKNDIQRFPVSCLILIPHFEFLS